MISLITPTLGRIVEVERLLKSLQNQSFHDFEIIIVDQNEHHEIEKLAQSFPTLNVIYIRSDRKGLSYNRNIGLKHAKGEIIGFPDDDCYYESNLLSNVYNKFQTEGNNCKLVLVQAKDISTEYIFVRCEQERVSRRDFFKRAISFNFFIRQNGNLRFDESLGIGAPYGSGEETDFLWENISEGDVCKFVLDTYVRHVHNTSLPNIERASKYGLGMGAIYKKEILGRKNYSMIIQYLKLLIRPLGAVIITKNHRYYWETFKRRIMGFVNYPI